MKTLKKITVDTIPVILGVLIALFIGEWKSNAKDKSYIDKMVGVMKKEAQTNLDDLNLVIPLHIRMIDTIDMYMDDENVSLTDLVLKNQGHKIALINNRTWNAVISSRIDLVDLETLNAVTIIDELENLKERKNLVLADHLYANVQTSSSQVKTIFRFHYMNLIETEIELVKYHVDFLGLEDYTNDWMEEYDIDLSDFE